MKLLVCGGRRYTDRKRIIAVLDALHDLVTFTQLAHGDAPGADTLASDWGVMRLGHQNVCAYPANWPMHGKNAGPRRNTRMLERFKPDLVVAFPGSTGTADMVRKAKAKKVRVLEVGP